MLLRLLLSRLDLGDQIYNKILLKIFKFQVGKPGAPLEYCGGKKKLNVFCILCFVGTQKFTSMDVQPKKKKKKRSAV